MSYLVDTNVISELCRRKPNQGVLTWAGGVTRLAISVVSVEEIFFRTDLEAERAGAGMGGGLLPAP